MTPTLFNLFLNSATSFIAGLFIVLLGLRLLRVPNDRSRLFLLSLPFVKIVWDLLSGLPSSSILSASLNPLLMPPKHGLLTLTAGFSKFGPQLNLGLATLGHDQVPYITSLPDYLYFALQKVSLALPLYLLIALSIISVALLCRRIFQCLVFEMERRRDRAHAEAYSAPRLGLRSVDIYISEVYTGSAFTGGILKPYICIPRKLFTELSPEELDAVIRHEVAHVKHFDLLPSFLIQVLGDIFWFVPGYSFLKNKIEALRELLADRDAVRSGASATYLASALLKTQVTAPAGESLAIYSAFLKRKVLVSERIEALLVGPQSQASFVWRLRYLRPLLVFWISGSVFMATLGGNNRPKVEIHSSEEFVEVLKNWVSW